MSTRRTNGKTQFHRWNDIAFKEASFEVPIALETVSGQYRGGHIVFGVKGEVAETLLLRA